MGRSCWFCRALASPSLLLVSSSSARSSRDVFSSPPPHCHHLIAARAEGHGAEGPSVTSKRRELAAEAAPLNCHTSVLANSLKHHVSDRRGKHLVAFSRVENIYFFLNVH